MTASLVGPVTHGQMAVWRDFESMSYDARVDIQSAWGWSLPPPASVSQLQDALSQLAERHEVLRTRYRPSSAGHLSQVIDPPSHVEVPQVTLDVNGDSDDLKDAVFSLSEAPFDLEREYSWRPHAVRCGDGPLAAGIVYSHIAADRFAGQVIRSEFYRLIAGSELHPPTSPRQLAERQNSPRWRARTDATRRYWDGLLRVLDEESLYLGRAKKNCPEYALKATLVSVDADVALRDLASSVRVSRSSALLAAYALAPVFQ